MPRISVATMRETLRPYLGSGIVDGTELCGKLAAVLRNYAPYRDTLDDLFDQLRRAVFNGLYEILGENMTLRNDEGILYRVHMDDIPQLADEALSVLFDGMEVYSVSYGILKDYSMRTTSLGAMRVLFTKYGAFQTEEEKQYLMRIIQENFPAERYSAWLTAAPVQDERNQNA